MTYKKLYVCEGKTDKDLLLNIGCYYVFAIGGLDLTYKDILFLKEISLKRRIVLVLDPDQPGRILGDMIKQEVKNIQVVRVDRSKARKGHKLGVAETDKTYLTSIIKPLIEEDEAIQEKLEWNQQDMIDLGLEGGMEAKARRNVLIQKHNLREVNAKRLREYLNFLAISKEKVRKELEDEYQRKNDTISK